MEVCGHFARMGILPLCFLSSILSLVDDVHMMEDLKLGVSLKCLFCSLQHGGRVGLVVVMFGLGMRVCSLCYDRCSFEASCQVDAD